MNETLLEKEYYPIVAKWLEKNFRCFKTGINLGTENSRADVIGVRDVGGDYSGDIETLIIEVKRDRQPFATAAGQTFGYTLYANRVYLADKRDKGFTPDEIMIANHLGIGLIQIDGKNKCSESLTSPYYTPFTRFNMKFLHALGLAKCQFCGTYFMVGVDDEKGRKITRENIKKALNEDKGMVFWLRDLDVRKMKYKSEKRNQNLIYERRYLCRECTKLLFIDRVEG